MSCDGCVALPRGAMSLRFVFVVFSDHTHYFSLAKDEKHLKISFTWCFCHFPIWCTGSVMVLYCIDS